MDGEELHLTPIEYKLLCLLAHNADKVLTHQFILHEIWGTATKSDLASLRVFMARCARRSSPTPRTRAISRRMWVSVTDWSPKARTASAIPL